LTGSSPAPPRLPRAQREALEAPFTYSELVPAVQDAASGRSPGLDGLPYEFYKHLVGLPLLEALNAMLEAGELGPSLRRGVIRLLPKVGGGGGPDRSPAAAHHPPLHRLQNFDQNADSSSPGCPALRPLLFPAVFRPRPVHF
jgi:hypothetical protein